MKIREGLVREGTGTTVHDVRAGSLHPVRLGTVEPVPEGLDLPRIESAASNYKRDRCVHGEDVGSV